MYFNGPGGVVTLRCAEVRRAVEDTTVERANGRAPQVALLKTVQSCFQIPASVTASRVPVDTRRVGNTFHLSLLRDIDIS